MGFFDSLKNFKKQIDTIESTVYSGKQSLLEVYERNLKLEAEIEVRTRELDTANRQMLTLQHVWDMMNSSKPLSSVLNAIARSLQGELGYLNTCITKHLTDKDGSYLQLVSFSGELFGANFLKFFKCEPSDLRLEFPTTGAVAKAIAENQVYQSTDIYELIKEVVPKASDLLIKGIVSHSKAKSYIMVPLAHKNEHFGCLILFSTREEATESELNFLNLFARQIELAITIADLFQAVKEQAITDPMTNLYNRRFFEESLQKELIRAKRQIQKFTIIGIDLDYLKKINDIHGHFYGDLAIKTIADVLKKSCRSIDIAARMGGEEFNVILPGVDSSGGKIFAERIRKTIEAVEIEKIGNITASIGVATYFEHSEDIDELLELADQAMYESKRNGRNQVTIAKPINEISWQDIALNTFTDILEKHRIPIDETTSELLLRKLQEINTNNEAVYQISDTLVKTYNPEHVVGGTKNKVLMTTLIAKRLELPKESIDKLKIATLLYDIGNTMLPKELLGKKEPLTEEEKLSIKQHPILAARKILEPISYVNDIIPIIEKHHENWNGTGYPNNISGDDIPIESQIILIVDSYFALLENRPYRRAVTKNEALEIILEDSNGKWSKKLAVEFAQVLKEEYIER